MIIRSCLESSWIVVGHGLVLEQCCLLIWVQCRSLRWLKCSQLPFGTPAAIWSTPRSWNWNLIQGLLRTQRCVTLSSTSYICNSRRNLQRVCYLKCVLLCLKSVISHWVSLRPVKFPEVLHGNIPAVTPGRWGRSRTSRRRWSGRGEMSRPQSFLTI